MNQTEANWDIILMERKTEDGDYIKITIDQLTQQRVVIEANSDILTDDEFDETITTLKECSASRFAICTGKNDLGFRFAKELQTEGRVALVVLPESNREGLDKFMVNVIEDPEPMLAFPDALKKVSIHYTEEPSDDEIDSRREAIAEGNGPTIYPDESTFF